MTVAAASLSGKLALMAAELVPTQVITLRLMVQMRVMACLGAVPLVTSLMDMIEVSKEKVRKDLINKLRDLADRKEKSGNWA